MIKQTTTLAVIHSQKRKKENQVKRRDKERTDAARLGISVQELLRDRFNEGQRIRTINLNLLAKRLGPISTT